MSEVAPLAEYEAPRPLSEASRTTYWTPAGMEGAEAGYASYMRIVREEPDDDLRAEVGQSVVLLGLVAVIVVIGLMMGLAL
jgi:hypothetical protein